MKIHDYSESKKQYKEKMNEKKVVGTKMYPFQTCQENVSKNKHLIITAIGKGKNYTIDSKTCFREN